MKINCEVAKVLIFFHSQQFQLCLGFEHLSNSFIYSLPPRLPHRLSACVVIVVFFFWRVAYFCHAISSLESILSVGILRYSTFFKHFLLVCLESQSDAYAFSYCIPFPTQMSRWQAWTQKKQHTNSNRKVTEMKRDRATPNKEIAHSLYSIQAWLVTL